MPAKTRELTDAEIVGRAQQMAGDDTLHSRPFRAAISRHLEKMPKMQTEEGRKFIMRALRMAVESFTSTGRQS